jgi:hypothetical protein
VERREEASGGRGGASVVEVSFRRLRRRWGRTSIVEGVGGMTSRVSGGGLGLGPFSDRYAGSPDCWYADERCCSRLVGSAAVPLAEKYSLRKSFRRIGRGVVEMGSLERGEVVKRRLGTTVVALDKRERHLGQMVLRSSRLCCRSRVWESIALSDRGMSLGGCPFYVEHG